MDDGSERRVLGRGAVVPPGLDDRGRTVERQRDAARLLYLFPALIRLRHERLGARRGACRSPRTPEDVLKK
jgi:hypothetical protein